MEIFEIGDTKMIDGAELWMNENWRETQNPDSRMKQAIVRSRKRLKTECLFIRFEFDLIRTSKATCYLTLVQFLHREE